jgi:hypothetical protein
MRQLRDELDRKLAESAAAKPPGDPGEPDADPLLGAVAGLCRRDGRDSSPTRTASGERSSGGNLTFEQSMEILPFDRPAAELAGRIRGDLERIGHLIGVANTMIAAIAIENGLELVTGNTSDFQRGSGDLILIY